MVYEKRPFRQCAQNMAIQAGSPCLEQYGFVSTAGSYMSSNHKRVHFGLGTDKKARLLEIGWPGGIVQRLEGVPADQVFVVREPMRSEVR